MRGLSSKLVLQILRRWLPVAAASTLLAGFSYTAVQQDLRQSANDPQIQLAEDTATAIAGGQAAQAVLPPGQVDIAHSLAPYIAVYDGGGSALASSGTLDGKPPILPEGVFGYVAHHGEDRFTWQPRPGIRA